MNVPEQSGIEPVACLLVMLASVYGGGGAMFNTLDDTSENGTVGACLLVGCDKVFPVALYTASYCLVLHVETGMGGWMLVCGLGTDVNVL